MGYLPHQKCTWARVSQKSVYQKFEKNLSVTFYINFLRKLQINSSRILYTFIHRKLFFLVSRIVCYAITSKDFLRPVKILFIALFFDNLNSPISLGIQRLSIENTLHRELDSSGYEGSTSADCGGGRDLQFELERAPRNCDRSVISETHYLDVCHQGRSHVPLRYADLNCIIHVAVQPTNSCRIQVS